MNRAGKSIPIGSIPRAVGFLLLLIGQAAADDTAQPFSISQGEQALPPLGYIDFCERHVDQCGPDVRSPLLLASETAPQDLAPDRNFPSAMVDDTAPPAVRFNWSAVFRILPVQGVTINPKTNGSSVQVMPTPAADVLQAGTGFLALTDDRWQILKDVNELVNSRVRSVSDIRHYGVSDFWELPIENGGNAGDCEDYVLEKRKILMARGFPMGALSIALVKTSWNESHAVLLVATSRGSFVLDNLTPLIKPSAAVSYTWVKWQLPNNSNIWLQPIQN